MKNIALRMLTGLPFLLLAGVLSIEPGFAGESDNLFPNPSAEEGTDMPAQWNHFTGDDTTFVRDASVAHSGSASARIVVGPKGAEGFPSFNCWFENVQPGEEYCVSVWAKARDVKNNWGPAMTVIFFAGNERLFPDCGGGDIGGGDRDWTRLESTAIVSDNANRMLVVMGLHSEGTAWFDDVSVVRAEKVHEVYRGDRLSLTVREDQVITDDFTGFGAHGDYYLTLPRCTRRGADDAAREMINRRIEEMRPGVMLVFFDYKWWEPEQGRQTPDSPEMQDLVYWMKLLQKLGTNIILTPWGDNFGYADWMSWDISKFPTRQGGPSGSLAPKLPPKDKQAAVMRSLADVVEYLRHDAGIANLKYLSICCEPDNDNIRRTDPEEFIGMLRMLDRELLTRGLRDAVKLLAPHASGGPVTTVGRYIKETMPSGKDVIDVMAAHTYAHKDTRLAPDWVRSHIDYLRRLEPGKPAKPFFIAEFGTGGDTFTNPENVKYEHGLFLADFGICAAREGASAVLMWCLMDTYYQGDAKQGYGLWRFGDEGWEPRPGFFSWSLVNRYTEPGGKVVSVDVAPQAESVPAVALLSPQGKLTVMAVNRGDGDITVSLRTGSQQERALRLYEYSRKTVPANGAAMIKASASVHAEPEKTVSFTLPGQSFVLLTDKDE